ncbi:FixH family protein [Parasphingorhabdus sp.]|uniref:FixH family protein n=1 Tax=Parasphingorhabdus sp. TaxID=2709688 RepID=UPI003A924C66
MNEKSSGTKIFTGYHATMMIVAFFAVVVGVNMVMARFALSTFGGTVVDNSYVASQKYNQWLEQARRQQAHGWSVSPAMRQAGRAVLTITSADGSGLQGASLTAVAEHPVGRSESFKIRFAETGAGKFHSTETLPSGRWILRINIVQDAKSMRVIRDIR